MLQSPISERLHYLTYIEALIFLPVEEMSHAASEHGNVTMLSGSVSSFVFFLLLFHGNTTNNLKHDPILASGFS